jgi:hypothetical protein
MRHLAVIAILLTFPANAPAQRRHQDGGPALWGVLAAGWLTDDESALGTGFDLEAGAGYRWRGPLAAQVQLGRLSTLRRFDSGVEFDARLVSLSGRLLYHFSTRHAEPYVGGALGLTRFKRTSVFPILFPGADGRPVRQGEDVFRHDGTEFTWGGVVGVSIRAARRVQLGPEVAVRITSPSNFVVVYSGIAIAWHR